MVSLHRLAVLFAALVAAPALAGPAEAATYLGHLDKDVTFNVGFETEFEFFVDQPATFTGTIIGKGSVPSVELFEAHDLSGFHSMTFDHYDLQSLPGDGRKVLVDIDLGTGFLYALSISAGISSGNLSFTFAAAPPVAATPIPPALLMFSTAIVGLFGFSLYGRRRVTP